MEKSADNQYLIEVPPEQAGGVQQLLQECGITMRPRYPEAETIRAERHTPEGSFHYTDTDLERLVRKTNRRLQSMRLAPTVPELHPGWSRDRHQDLLATVLEELSWNQDQISSSSPSDQDEWTRIVARHPILFGAKE